MKRRSHNAAVSLVPENSADSDMLQQPEEMYAMRSKKKKSNLIMCTLITALVFIISGIVLIICRFIIYENSKSEILNIKTGTKTFEMFKKTPFDVYFDVYFFNWTNPKEVNDPDKKPRVTEVGPFRFKEVIEKTNIVFHENNNTMSYNRTRRWYFVREQSAYGLEEPITTINPVAVSGAYTLRDQHYILKKGFSFSLNSIEGSLDMTKTAGDMLFFGVDDPLMKIALRLPFLKNMPPFDKFAWFYQRNGSNIFDGTFNMQTSGPNFGQIRSWNNLNYTPFYQDKCADIVGSAGEFFPPNLSKDPLGIYNIEMCRTIFLDFEKETSKKWIDGYKFTVGDHFLDNGTKIKENRCSCTGECVPYGAVNVSSCRYGSPGFVTLPHFYKADPYYNSLIDGLNPTERHNFYMILEPTTGIPLEVAARLQLNLMVKKVPGISLMEDIKDVFFPMLWFEEVVEIPTLYSFALMMLLWMKEICLTVGLIMITIGMSMIYYTIHKICTTNLCGKEKKNQSIIKELVPLNQEKIR